MHLDGISLILLVRVFTYIYILQAFESFIRCDIRRFILLKMMAIFLICWVGVFHHVLSKLLFFWMVVMLVI
jgi:hypothetical protein